MSFSVEIKGAGWAGRQGVKRRFFALSRDDKARVQKIVERHMEKVMKEA